MIDQYWPHGFTKIDKINHYFISNGTQFEAQGIPNSHELVAVLGHEEFVEVYHIDELLAALEEADGSSIEVTKLITEGGLAL